MFKGEVKGMVYMQSSRLAEKVIKHVSENTPIPLACENHVVHRIFVIANKFVKFEKREK